MSFPNPIRWGAFSAILGGLLGIALTPVSAAAGRLAWGNASPNAWNNDMPILIRPFKGYVEYMFTLPMPNEVYPTYGKVFLVVFLLFIGGLLGLNAMVAEQIGSKGRLGFRLALIGLVMNLFGNVSDYWLGYEILGQPWWGLAFVIGTEIGYLVYMIGSILIGKTLLREDVLPKWIAWSLIIAPPLGVFFLFWGIEHIPSGLALALSGCWLLVGVAILSHRAPALTQVDNTDFPAMNPKF